MKIIDAVWEKRNLGINVIEIQTEQTDSLIDIENTLKSLSAEYMVVKIPVGNFEMMVFLEEQGFHFIECLLKTEGDEKTYLQIPSYAQIPAIQKLNKKCTYSKMDNMDLNTLYGEIRKSLFTTDRIYLDPYFKKEQAAFRYEMWIKDEIENGSAEAFKVEYQKDTVGFFVHRQIEEGVYQGILMGVYGDYMDTGFGYIVDLKEREEHIKKSRRSIGYISSNNISRCKLSFSEPSILTDIQYVYIKHNDTGGKKIWKKN